MSLFEIRDVDKRVYEQELRDFLPEKMIDIHCHVYKREEEGSRVANERIVGWTNVVAKDNSIEDLQETYKLMFPDKNVKALMFSSIRPDEDFEEPNKYVSDSSKKSGFPALYYSHPEMSAEYLEKQIFDGGFYGIKAYLDHVPSYIPANEIRIYDYITPEHLALMDKHGWIVMCHIPRSGRLKDKVNLAQLMEIDEKYPNLKLIVAHIGRAYCESDFGDAFEVLSKSKNLLFDFSANCLDTAMVKLIEAVGTDRIMFGSDMPILRLRTKRICEDGKYINLIKKGAYGDVSGDSHMREIEGEEADNLTFFMYEEILAFKRAAQQCNLTKEQVADVFYNNAAKLLGLEK